MHTNRHWGESTHTVSYLLWTRGGALMVEVALLWYKAVAVEDDESVILPDAV